MAQSSSGIGFAGLLTVVFVTLKLTGFISWSWWWVLSPIWISCLLGIGILAIVILIFMKVGNITFKDVKDPYKRKKSEKLF